MIRSDRWILQSRKNVRNFDPVKIEIDRAHTEHTEVTKTIYLLGITMGDELSFKERISELCIRASKQLNTITYLQKTMGKEQNSKL